MAVSFGGYGGMDYGTPWGGGDWRDRQDPFGPQPGGPPGQGPDGPDWLPSEPIAPRQTPNFNAGRFNESQQYANPEAGGGIGDRLGGAVGDAVGGVGDFIGWGEMEPQYKAALIAQLLSTGVNAYQQHQQGKAREEERDYLRDQYERRREGRRENFGAIAPYLREFLQRGQGQEG